MCLQNACEMNVPKKGVLDRLCHIGLGSKYFTSNEKLGLELYLSPEELYFVILCLYPQLKGIPYEFCKAAGPGNSVLVPLTISDECRRPSRGQPFRPYFSSDELTQMVERKGKLYIRPLDTISASNCPTLTEIEVCFVFTTFSQVSVRLLLS